MPPSMPLKNNRRKRKNAAPSPTQTDEQTVVAKPSIENDAPPQNPPSDDAKPEGQMSEEDIRQSTICDYYMIL